MGIIDMDSVQCAVIIKDTWYNENDSDTITTVYIKDNLNKAYEYMVDNVEHNKRRGNVAYIINDETINGVPIKCVMFDGKNNRVSNWELAHVN